MVNARTLSPLLSCHKPPTVGAPHIGSFSNRGYVPFGIPCFYQDADISVKRGADVFALGDMTISEGMISALSYQGPLWLYVGNSYTRIILMNLLTSHISLVSHVTGGRQNIVGEVGRVA